MKNLKIDSDRLWASLMEMAEIGATEKGGVCRLALTDLDRAGRDLFVRWCEEAGCTVNVDRLGNIFRPPARPGRNPPAGDGGQPSRLPADRRQVRRRVRRARRAGGRPHPQRSRDRDRRSGRGRGLDQRGGQSIFAAYDGLWRVRRRLRRKRSGSARPDNVTGELLGDELGRIGYDGAAPVGGREIGAYFEAHIEQGPILENEAKTIGVVTGAQGQRWYEVTVTGQEAHAGPTPMKLRKDALVAAARMVDAVNRIGHEFPPDACATVGFVESSPNSRNTIPGRVFFTVDLRNPDDATLAAMNGRLRADLAAIAEAAGCTVEIVDFWDFPATPFDEACVSAVRAAAEQGGHDWRDIVSGAGHDAVYIARVAPSAMIFIPCEDGISHNEIENATQEDCAAGAEVLLQAVLDRAVG